MGRYLLLCAAVMMAAAGCSKSEEDKLYKKKESYFVLQVASELWVNPKPEEQMTEVDYPYMLYTKRDGKGEWETRFTPGQIVGFTYEPGTEYILVVGQRELKDPPADHSAFVFKLRQIIDREVKNSEGLP